jgi:hypothetical protein
MARLFDDPKIRADLAKIDAPVEEPEIVPSHRITPKIPGSKGGVQVTAPKPGKDDRGA